MSKKHKAIMVYMDESDLAALAEVRKRLGATTNSGAIRAALRVIMHDSQSRGGIIGAATSKAIDTGNPLLKVLVDMPSPQKIKIVKGDRDERI